MTIKTTQVNQTDETKQRVFAPIQRDLLDRLTRACESQAGTPWDQPMLITPQKTSAARSR